MVIKKGVYKILSCVTATSLISGIAAQKDVVKAIATKNIIASWERARMDESATKISNWIEQETEKLLREKKFRDCFAQMDSCAFIMLCYCVYSSKISRKIQRLSDLVGKRTKDEINKDLNSDGNISGLQYCGENITDMIRRILGLAVEEERLNDLGRLLVSFKGNHLREDSSKRRRDRYGKWNTGYAAEIREALAGDAYRYDDDE